MKEIQQVINQTNQQSTLIRLTALWALNEAALGGILHLFRIPFTGLIVGGGAVLILALIAHISDKPERDIPKALFVVLLIKVIVSPHAPFTAYIAMGFQAGLAILIFKYIRSFKIAALSFSIIALLETALQKLLLVALLFGKPLWESVDAFIDFVLQRFGLLASDVTVQASFWLVALYLGIYLIGSTLIGWLAGRMPDEIKMAQNRLASPDFTAYDFDEKQAAKERLAWYKKPAIKWTGVILILIFGIYYFVPASAVIIEPIWLLARVIILLTLWYLIVAPFAMRFLNRFIKRKSSTYHEEVQVAMSLLPDYRKLVGIAWRETKGLKGYARFKELIIRIVTYSLTYSKGV